ncbi:hypothetical protein V6615_10105 [Oscillospiraceae bacterium PP1C4]
MRTGAHPRYARAGAHPGSFSSVRKGTKRTQGTPLTRAAAKLLRKSGGWLRVHALCRAVLRGAELDTGAGGLN